MADSLPPITLPVLDISNPLDPATGKALLDAAATYGFLYVDSRGTDFTAEEVDRAFELSKTFFASPVEEKEKCRIEPNNRGWSGMHSETLDPEHQRTGDFKEAFNFGEFLPTNKAQQPLPASLTPHEAEIAHFASLCNKTCSRILTLLALGLGIPPDFFTTRHDPTRGPTGSILRYLYYPSISAPETSSYKHDVDVRAGAHSDYGSITLLFQRPGQPGLEILPPSSVTAQEKQEWASVPVIPVTKSNNNNSNSNSGEEIEKDNEKEEEYPFPPILINIGDLLSYWTNGLLKSTVHRVVFPLSEQRVPNPQDRYSIAFFCHPMDRTELVPVPSRVVEEYHEKGVGGGGDGVGFGGGAGRLGEGRTITAHEHLMARLNATYSFRKD
ncbi:Clavaminate synthase-like protein [Aspergillus heteromorphus CBS 117.55]|uniref:Clavaminate synthase-like protein n=1 Tax=Aspergillus heteromorphus CBS 117.55 TaxID=1448321 RepID=A0A317WEY5_9EURO|nr:Clavaminate synthase-like protein [Aspergillus heteromorphus CBS 117.55]PWY84963.1 Clavaminate synthase-like protein [Aspergillus heteromorphus CBS 117.55]